MVSIGESVLNAVVPILKLLSIALIGLILTHPKIEFIPKATYKILSKLVFVLFLPCLIFNNLGPYISLKNFMLWWFIPVNIVLSTAIGFILGYLVTLICRPPPQFFRFTIIMTAFGNTGYIPLAVVTSVCRNTDNVFGDECNAAGIAYVSFSQWVSIVLVYTIVYHMMEPTFEEEEDDEDNEIEEIEEVPVIASLSRPLLVEAEWPGFEEKETELCKKPFIAKLFSTISGISHRNIPHLDDSVIEEDDEKNGDSNKCWAEPKMVKKIRTVAKHTPIQHILQPPTFAFLLSVLVGIIPGLKPIFFGIDSPLEFITDSLDIMSEAAIPSVMLILGGMLIEGPNESTLGIRTTIGITVARLLVLPLIGIGVICLADKWNCLIAGDELYRFVLFLQYTTPSALLLGAIASLRGYAVSEASALLFWQHIFAMFSLALYLIVYFNFLLTYV